MALLVGGTVFTALAGMAMLLKIYSRRNRHRGRIHNGDTKSTETDAQCLIDTQDVQGLEHAQVTSDRTRSRGHVRFQIDEADSAVDVPV